MDSQPGIESSVTITKTDSEEQTNKNENNEDEDEIEYCVIEASVVTGFEECARGEAKEKFGTDVKAARGKITWKVPMDKVKYVTNLGSIDNARVVLHSVPHFKFTDQDDSLARLQKMVPNLNWESGIQVWRQFYDFPYDIPAVPDVIPSPEELVEIIIMKNLPKPQGEKKSKKGRKEKMKEKRKNKNKNKEVPEEKTDNGDKNNISEDKVNKSDDNKKKEEIEIVTSNIDTANSSEENDKAESVVKSVEVDDKSSENQSLGEEVSETSVKNKGDIPSPKTVVIKKVDPNRKQPDINIKVLDENVFPLTSDDNNDRLEISMDVDASMSIPNIETDLSDKNMSNSGPIDNEILTDTRITDGSSVDPESYAEITNSEILKVTPSIDLNKQNSNSEIQSPSKNEVVKKERDPTKPTFRVTCNRVGEGHQFDSSSAAACFGSAINRYFGWPVDLKNFDFEILLNIDNEEVTVSIALTKVSLHNRNLTAFGPTTLRSTIAYNMLRLCRIKNGDFICDPMCGTSAIPIESAFNWKSCYHFGGDFHEKAMERTVLNIDHIQEKLAEEKKGTLKIDAVQWNIQHFPLRDQCVDVFVSDLPFGHRMGSHSNNRTLYPCLLSEMARTGRSGARACLLTEDKTSLIKAIQTFSNYWKRRVVLSINIGGLNGFVFLLTRTAAAVTGTETARLLAQHNKSKPNEKRNFKSQSPNSDKPDIQVSTKAGELINQVEADSSEATPAVIDSKEELINPVEVNSSGGTVKVHDTAEAEAIPEAKVNSTAGSEINVAVKDSKEELINHIEADSSQASAKVLDTVDPEAMPAVKKSTEESINQVVTDSSEATAKVHDIARSVITSIVKNCTQELITPAEADSSDATIKVNVTAGGEVSSTVNDCTTELIDQVLADSSEAVAKVHDTAENVQSCVNASFQSNEITSESVENEIVEKLDEVNLDS